MKSLTKRCSICKRELPATTEFFNKNAHCAQGLNPRCKECRNAIRQERRDNSPELREKNRQRARRWYYEDIERARANAREYARTHSADAVGRTRQWRRDNPERYRERTRLDSQRWVKNNPEKSRAVVLNYQARRRDAPGEFTADDIQALYEAQNGRCQYCGTPLNGVYDIDHVIPLSRNGTNHPENLVLACPSCNRSKGDRLPSEWKPNGSSSL